MTKQNQQFLVAAALVAATSVWSAAQAPQPGNGAARGTTGTVSGGGAAAGTGRPGPPQPMSFFVTSAGSGNGANLGGIAGADRICQTLATAAGRGRPTWHAYLSAQRQRQAAVNARDRIGAGPWFNAKGARIAQNVGDLHGDTLEQARLRQQRSRSRPRSPKRATSINGVGDTPNQHDMLTGSQLDGTRLHRRRRSHLRQLDEQRDDRHGAARPLTIAPAAATSRGTRRMPSRGCSQENLVATGGAGRFYCFAAGAPAAR